jgi:tetratricopeptide (TPR) repeat protein
VGECSTTSRNPDKLLDEADRQVTRKSWSAAFACADIAADLRSSSVEAHHLRAVALAGLGRYAAAQTSFAMALALDPDDPETLAASANFYINIIKPRRRGTTLLGLEQARRGEERAARRRRRDRRLRARLSLLAAQALNDLARPKEALPHVAAAIALIPDLADAKYERGIAQFHLCQFAAAKASFLAVLAESPDDPFAHHHLGLLYERAGRMADARAHFKRARKLSHGEISAPVPISAAQFRSEVTAAVAELGVRTRTLLAKVAIETPDLPTAADLTATDPPFSPTILGLYRGLPIGVEPTPGEPSPPRAIVLYRKNLARAARTRAELSRQIRRTLQHEIGHLRGLDEAQLRRKGLD